MALLSTLEVRMIRNAVVIGRCQLMRILVFGAGVLGSLYAARLHGAGHDVTLFARGDRLKALNANGVQLEQAVTGVKETVRVPVVGVVGAEIAYDVVLVFVRGDQLATASRSLAEQRVSGSLLFMVNNPAGFEPLSRTVGAERLMLGLAGAGGYREGDTVKYVVLPRFLQPTTLGEPDGSETARIRAAGAAMRSAGFPVVISRSMDAWYKYHAAWVTPVAYAIYAARAAGSSLAERPDLLRELVDATRELWRALGNLGHKLTPTDCMWSASCPVGFSFPSSHASRAPGMQMRWPSGTPTQRRRRWACSRNRSPT